MREILFRGKRIDDNRWVEGGIMRKFHPNFPHESERDFYFQKENCYVICANNRDIFVAQNTIGQFTGLTDKNGKKIFEGDIVKVTGLYPDRDREKRIWRQFRVGEIFYYHGAFYFDKWLLCKTSEKCIEIISNIHDNPELLEDKP